MSGIDTKHVTDRRPLAFPDIAALHAEIDRLTAADLAGRVRATGNWTLGQALGHCAAWCAYPYEGYPAAASPPWFVKLIGRAFRGRFLSGRLPAGVRIPGVEGGTFGIEPMSTADGATQLHRQLKRLERQAPPLPNPVFGPLTHAEWIQLHLGHAALHLSFFHSEP